MMSILKKNKLSKKMVVILSFALLTVFSPRAPLVHALSFQLGSSADVVQFLGGVGNTLTTTNGGVSSVAGITISNGLLNYETGNFQGILFANPNALQFGSGGSLSITGDIGSGNVTLLSGSFFDESVLSYNSLDGSASWTASLNITTIDSTLANISNITGGTITQIQMSLALTNSGLPENGFTGSQDSGTVDVTSSAVPEPSSLLLLGSGLLGLGLLVWKREKNVQLN